jgi:DNA-binding transcriptional MerR regulator
MRRRQIEDADAAAASPPAAMPGLRSGELARRAGVSKDTLRFYERKGLLEPPRRTANNYRLFPREAVETLRWIRHALAIGFTVEELSRIAGARSRGQYPCHEVRALAAAKLEVVEQRLRQMTSFRRRYAVSWTSGPGAWRTPRRASRRGFSTSSRREPSRSPRQRFRSRSRSWPAWAMPRAPRAMAPRPLTRIA